MQHLNDTRPETWLPVVGWEGFYDISDLGRVRTAEGRVMLFKDGRVGYRRAKVMAQHPNRSGYMRVKFHRDGRNYWFLVHILVLVAFAGPRPTPQHQTLHGRGGTQDNRWPENIRWGTPAENAADRERDGMTSRGEHRPLAKLTDVIVTECRARYAAGETQTALAAEFGVSVSALNVAVRGRTWTHLMAGDHADGHGNRGERSSAAKLTEVIVRTCRRRYAAGETQTALAAEFGVNVPTMSNAIRGITWRHVT